MSKYDKNQPSQYDSLFHEAANAHGVSYDFLRKVAFNESSFNPNAKSPTGPLGMMQFTKATGKAMGLNITGGPDDDRLDPAKSINAAARHISQLVTKYDGDELAAALAYNQGEGPKGLPQLEAYKRGDFSKISAEGLNYMRKLTDVARSERKGDLEAFGGITPKAKAVDAGELLKGTTPESKVGTELPEAHGIDFVGKEGVQKANTFATDFWKAHGTTPEEYDNRSTFHGLKESVEKGFTNSTGGFAYRAIVDHSFDVFLDAITPTKWNSHTFTPEELQKIRDSGIPASYYNAIGGASPETLDDLIALAKESYEYERKAADSGIGAQLVGAVADAVGDPTTYLMPQFSLLKGAKLASKLGNTATQAVVGNVASEALRTSIVGGEADYQGAVYGGILFGTGMSVLSDVGSKAVGFVKSNGYDSTVARLEVRENSRLTGDTDHTLMSTENLEFSDRGYAQHPVEEGAVVLPNGVVLSASNPINPKNLEAAAEVSKEIAPKANAGVGTYNFTELGYKVLRSESNEVRGLAADLVRSPTGMEGGSHGKFGATASDIHERLSGNDNKVYRALSSSLDKAMKDPEFSVGPVKMSKRAVQQEIYKRAALAIERPELAKGLTPGELEVMNLLKSHFDFKGEIMTNPSMFGNKKAVSIMPNSRHKGTYVPHVYDRTAKVDMISRFGTEGLQEAISESWQVSYRSRPEVKARVDEYLKELYGVEEVTADMVEKYAKDKAYGISHTSDFESARIIEDPIGDNLKGLENNSFLEARNLFDSDMPITLPDGSTFSVNDLRSFDMNAILPAYNRRVNGDIAIMGSTGKTTKDLKDEIVALQDRAKSENNGKLKEDAKALGEVLKILTGRARRDPDGVWGTLASALGDYGFIKSSAYMGIQNFTEVAGLLSKGRLDFVTNNIPVINKLVSKRNALSAKEVQDLHGMLFGRELDDTIRPSREDIIQNLRDNTSSGERAVRFVGSIKAGTSWAAAKSPFTWLLNESTNGILNTARQGVILDIADHVLKGKKSAFGRDNLLNSASISKEQWEGIKNLFKEYTAVGADGKYTIKDKDAMARDPRSMDLWRMADRFADEVMVRPHKVSNMDLTAHNALTRMAVQFKTFTIKSMNGRAARAFWEAKHNGRVLDQAISATISVGLQAAFIAGALQVKSLGMTEERRREYLDKNMNPYVLATLAVLRSSVLAGPGGLALMGLGIFTDWEPAKAVRTSITPKQPVEREHKGPWRAQEFISDMGGNLLQQVPSVGAPANLAAAAFNFADLMSATNVADEYDARTGLMQSLQQVVPNDPLSQWLTLKMFQEQGINRK